MCMTGITACQLYLPNGSYGGSCGGPMCADLASASIIFFGKDSDGFGCRLFGNRPAPPNLAP